ncbi:MAG: type II secretion system F family protein [Helicobacteraceae bacterium]|jgi:general secretion pathway protein F|nr:type II secretion system F family protein [Helicobacteraceae bacterium]
MKHFTATVLSKGKKTEHRLYAEGKKEAHYMAKVKFPGILVKLDETSAPLEEQFAQFKANIFKNFKKKKLKPDAHIAAIRQLAVMTNAGISVHDALADLADATDDPTLKEILTKSGDDINAGSSLYKAMDNYRSQLGGLTLAMIDLGEKTGNMAEALYNLADMLEEIRANMVKFKKAMAYPRNVMIAMAVAFSILLTFVVPKFEMIFSKFKAGLPLPTVILQFLSKALVNYGLYILAAIAIIYIVVKYLIENNEDFRYRVHQLLLRLYLIKGIVLYSTLSRFTLVFSELVRSGIPIAEALDTAISMTENLPLKAKLSTIRQAVEKGNSLHEGLEDTGLFENMIIQMIKAGESSGALDAMLQKVTEYYKMKFDAIIDGLQEAIEPIMLFVIGAMVLLLALGIFLPMWSLGEAALG